MQVGNSNFNSGSFRQDEKYFDLQNQMLEQHEAEKRLLNKEICQSELMISKFQSEIQDLKKTIHNFQQSQVDQDSQTQEI